MTTPTTTTKKKKSEEEREKKKRPRKSFLSLSLFYMATTRVWRQRREATPLVSLSVFGAFSLFAFPFMRASLSLPGARADKVSRQTESSEAPCFPLRKNNALKPFVVVISTR